MVPTACFLKYTRQELIKYPALAATLKRIAKKMVVMSLQGRNG
jgi:hypothetical protein